MTVKGGDKVFKKLLNKLKNIITAIAAGRIPVLKVEVYKKGGFMPATPKKIKLDDEEEIITLEAWRNYRAAIMAEGMENCIKAVKSLQDELDRINRENTNNWRKMHGLPMMRNAGQRKKHKR